MPLIPAILAAVAALAILALVVVCVVNAARRRRAERLSNEKYFAWRSAIDAAGGDLTPVDVPIHLKNGEICYFADPTATLLEPRAVRSGGFGGGSIRVARGVSIHTGRIASESHDEWRRITTGALYVTNKRIIFDGATKNRIIPIADVMSVVANPREALLNSEKLQKPVAFGSINGQIFAAVVNSIADQS